MFASDFAEGSLSRTPALGVSRTASGSSEYSAYGDDFEDSDEESEYDDEGLPSSVEHEEFHDAHGNSDTSDEGSPENHNEAKGKDEPGATGAQRRSNVPGPVKVVIEVKDVAYRTYKSILYWVSTSFRSLILTQLTYLQRDHF